MKEYELKVKEDSHPHTLIFSQKIECPDDARVTLLPLYAGDEKPGRSVAIIKEDGELIHKFDLDVSESQRVFLRIPPKSKDYILNVYCSLSKRELEIQKSGGSFVPFRWLESDDSPIL